MLSKYIKNKVILNQIISSLDGEIWGDVPEYEGIYKCSTLGRVLSLNRIIPSPTGVNGGSFRRGLRLLKQKKHKKTGYMMLALCKNGVRKDVLVHRLVAYVFIPNTDNLPFINHKNFDRSDNKVGNLEWCTQLQNIHHAIENGKIPTVYGEKTSGAKLCNEQVLSIFKDERSLEIIAKDYGVARGVIG